MLRKWDIVINSTGVGTLGRVAQVTSVPEPMTVDSHVTIVRPNQKVVDARFLGLAIRALEAEVEALGEGSTGQTELSRSRLAELRILLPPIGEQRAIAHILGTLDDKIELNRKTAATLEAMAQALFKAWFVDFEPVRAKMEGRWRRGESLPGLPAHLFDVFPDRLVDTDQGEIPEGWRSWRLEQLVTLKRETVSPGNDYETLFTHFSIAAYDQGQWPTSERGYTIKSIKTRVPLGAVLLSKLNPEVNRVWLTPDLADGFRVCSTEFLCFTAKPPAGRHLLYCLFKNEDFRETMVAMATGTSKSHQRVSPRALLEVPVLCADRGALEAFEARASPLLEGVLWRQTESRTLAALRDTLLPKLVSGELRVKDAERFLAERGL